jgi:hypothetical protein
MREVAKSTDASERRMHASSSRDYTLHYRSNGALQTIALPSHGRGRWFEPSIAYTGKAVFQVVMR